MQDLLYNVLVCFSTLFSKKKNGQDSKATVVNKTYQPYWSAHSPARKEINTLKKQIGHKYLHSESKETIENKVKLESKIIEFNINKHSKTEYGIKVLKEIGIDFTQSSTSVENNFKTRISIINRR